MHDIVYLLFANDSAFNWPAGIVLIILEFHLMNI